MSKHEIAAPSNAANAQRLEATARLLEEQAANLFRVRAYRQAAATVERLGEPAGRTGCTERRTGWLFTTTATTATAKPPSSPSTRAR